MLNGKIILGGLALTLCAKAALSFPELPLFKDSALPQQPMVVLAAETKEGNGPATGSGLHRRWWATCPNFQTAAKRPKTF